MQLFLCNVSSPKVTGQSTGEHLDQQIKQIMKLDMAFWATAHIQKYLVDSQLSAKALGESRVSLPFSF